MAMKSAEARAVLDSILPAIDPAEKLAVAIIAQLETGYGNWNKPDGTPTAGTGSNNWGAVTGSGNAGFFVHADSRPGNLAKGEPLVVHYETRFARYSTPRDGAMGVLNIVRRKWPMAIVALRNGDFAGFSSNLYGYYLGTSQSRQANIEAHVKRVRGVISGRSWSAAFGDLLPKAGPALPAA